MKRIGVVGFDRVAALDLGFGGADSFRRAFERRFGVSPTTYRGRFEARHRGRIKQAQNAQIGKSK